MTDAGRSAGAGTFDLNGIAMRTTSSDVSGVVSAMTTLRFEQVGGVVSARYRGGPIVDGYLIGHLTGTALRFRYVQADVDGRLDAGISDGSLERLGDGRLRLIERFQWLTRPEHGTNVFEEVSRSTP
jgi:hypothetical protein